ncbi:VCBS repeat-containing protein [Phenylobacterium sp. LjRoot225]|uniref:FG-GAP repeat domain-containing protein n=1 Tax=Phenylobacterium sp. LjRoot225 TaxID=3342285 RepID=UPI003ECF392F
MKFTRCGEIGGNRRVFIGGVHRAAAVIAKGAVALGLIGWAAASAQERPTLSFSDVSATHLPQAPELHAMEAAAIDVDKDGDLDLAIAVEYGVNRLYLNDGNGRFSWKPGAFGDVMHDSEHVRAADFDNDGNMDLVFVAESDEVHQLFLGDGKGGFVDASDRLPGSSQGNAVVVGDLNGDGLTDIVVGNTGEPPYGETGERPARNFLWLNDRKRPGHFIDATARNLPDTDDQTEGLDLADMDGDGDLDLLVASATKRNRLLLNDGKGRFRDVSDRLELLVPMETRDVHAFDANGDGKLDLLYSNLTSNNHGWEKDPQTRLLINDGAGRYKDETAARLPSHRFSSWATTIMDFNHDGRPDIIVSAIEVPGFVPLQMRAWQNDGGGHFKDVTLSIIPSLTVGRSWNMTEGDFDGDGKLDLFVGTWGTQARLLLTDEQKIRASRPPFKLLRPADRRF